MEVAKEVVTVAKFIENVLKFIETRDEIVYNVIEEMEVKQVVKQVDRDLEVAK